MRAAAARQPLLFRLPPAVDVARPRRHQKTYKAALLSEFEAFVAAAPDQDYCDLFMLMRWSGLRVSEATSLCWEHIDFAMPQIHRLVGKGNVERDVDLLPEAEKMLFRRRAEITAPVLLSNFIFPGNSEIGCISPRAVQRVMQKMRAKLGIPQDRGHPHSMRHLFASDGLDKGVPLQVVSAQLGHANISTTSTYLHSRPGQMRRVYEKRAE